MLHRRRLVESRSDPISDVQMGGHRKAAIEGGLLRNVTQVAEGLRALEPRVGAHHPNASRAGTLEGDPGLDERRLACCVWAHQCGDRSCRNAERQVRQRTDPTPVPLGKVRRLKSRVGMINRQSTPPQPQPASGWGRGVIVGPETNTTTDPSES